MDKTIAAIATATGVGSIAIIRVSGKDALEISSNLIDKKLSPRVASLCSIYNSKKSLIDRAICIYFKAPNSFTGEDIVEFQCHGGLVVAQEILDTLIFYGASLAKPGEFTQRAFLNGKIDLTEAEAIAKMIETKSIDGAKILARQLKGELREFIDSAREKILLLLAHSEVMIDYAEEDIPTDIMDNLKDSIIALRDDLSNIVKTSLKRKGIIEGFWLSIVGKPNVGKSSILNKMLNYDRAIVSDIAGTTRDSIEEQIRIGSHIVKIADTAGIREATDEIEKLGVKRSIDILNDSDIIIAVFDNSRELDSEDKKIIELLKEKNDSEIIVVINKIDQNSRLDTTLLNQFDTIKLSAKESVEPLFKKIEDILNSISKSDEMMLVSSRQIDSVKEALTEISNAVMPLENSELEFFSYHLNSAVKYLDEITKPYSNEEILDKMFSEFCLGK